MVKTVKEEPGCSLEGLVSSSAKASLTKIVLEILNPARERLDLLITGINEMNSLGLNPYYIFVEGARSRCDIPDGLIRDFTYLPELARSVEKLVKDVSFPGLYFDLKNNKISKTPSKGSTICLFEFEQCGGDDNKTLFSTYYFYNEIISNLKDNYYYNKFKFKVTNSSELASAVSKSMLTSTKVYLETLINDRGVIGCWEDFRNNPDQENFYDLFPAQIFTSLEVSKFFEQFSTPDDFQKTFSSEAYSRSMLGRYRQELSSAVDVLESVCISINNNSLPKDYFDKVFRTPELRFSVFLSLFEQIQDYRDAASLWKVVSDYRKKVVLELMASITKKLKIISKASESLDIETYYPYIEFHYLSYLTLDFKDKKLTSEKQELYGSLLSVIKHNIESGVIDSPQQRKVQGKVRFIDKVRETVKKLEDSFEDNAGDIIKTRNLIFENKLIVFDQPVSDESLLNFKLEEVYTKNLSDKLSDIPDSILADKNFTLVFDICECRNFGWNYNSYTRAKNKVMILHGLFGERSDLPSVKSKVALQNNSSLFLISKMLKELNTFNSVTKPTEIDPFDVSLKHFLEQLEENTITLLNTENNN